MVEEQVIQSESVTPAEQPVAETPAPQVPNIDAVKAEYEAKLAVVQQELDTAKEDRSGVKRKSKK